MELARILNWDKYYIKYYPDTKILEINGKMYVEDFVALKKVIKENKFLKKRILEIRVV